MGLRLAVNHAFQEAQVVFAEPHSCDLSGLILTGSSQGAFGDSSVLVEGVCGHLPEELDLSSRNSSKFRGHFPFSWLPVVNVI